MLKTRFAPSPTGPLHLGHAFSVLTAYSLAKKYDGRLLLRIEDIDYHRCSTRFENAIFDDLRFLNIEWDPIVVKQSDRIEVYRDSITKLQTLGLIYSCDCTRSDIANALTAPSNAMTFTNLPKVYPGTCRNQSKKASGLAKRLNIKKCFEYLGVSTITFHEESTPLGCSGKQQFQKNWLLNEIGDVVISRKDISTSYHLSCVVDDEFQGITQICRGEDLFHITPLHVILQNILGFKTPAYHHHKLITDKNGIKLSKSLKSKSLKAFREDGANLFEIQRILHL